MGIEPGHQEDGAFSKVLPRGDAIGVRLYVLKPGEVLHFKKGSEGAHQVINHTDKEVRLVMISNQASPDVVEYPDQKLMSVITRRKSQHGQALWRLIDSKE